LPLILTILTYLTYLTGSTHSLFRYPIEYYGVLNW